VTDRITETFKNLKKQGRKALVGYLTAGDPTVAASEQNARIALQTGLDLLELGVPFSDPTADGPTIQMASRRALDNGIDVARILDMVRRIRKDFQAPIVLFGYANPFLRYGYERLCADAAAAGVDGFLGVDMPFEESAELRSFMDRQNLVLVSLIAPTTPAERASAILKNSRGFVYYITLKGVTGARESVAADISERVAMLRACTKLPIVVGFGVSNGAQARSVASTADGVVVGSALVKAATENRLQSLVSELRSALDRKA